MNTFMWQSPFTEEHLQRMQRLGAIVIPPVVKTLACGDTGIGAMASPADVVTAMRTALQLVADMQPGRLAQWPAISTPGAVQRVG